MGTLFRRVTVFEGGLEGDEKEVSDQIQSVIFQIIGANGMNIRHFNDEQIDSERADAIRTPKQLKIPEFLLRK